MNQPQHRRCRRGAQPGRSPHRRPRHGARWVAGGPDADWQRVLAALPALETLAAEQGAFARRRAVRSAADLLRLVLVYAVGGLSLRLTAAWATACGVAALSDVAVLWRLRRCLPLLRALVAAQLAAHGAAVPAAAAGRRLRVIDGTVISGPASTGTDWRVHLDYAPLAQQPTGIALTDAHGGESLARWTFAPGDLALADRGFCRAPGIAHVLDQGADVVVRLNTGAVPLFAAASADAALDLAAWLGTGSAKPATTRPVWIRLPKGPRQPLRWVALRLVACRLPPAKASAARRRLRQQAKKCGRTPTRLSRRAAGFLLLLTSLEPQAWPADAVVALYRFRWQIELLFKRWKGLLGLGRLAAKDPTLAQVCLLARLLVALVIDGWSPPPPREDRLTDPARPPSPWRCFAAGVACARHAILGPLSLAAWTAALPRLRRFLCDPPRRRPNQAHALRLFLRLAHQTPPALS